MWKLHERKWIAARFDDQALEHLVIDRRREDGLEKRAGVAMAEWLDVHLGQAPECLVRHPRAEHDGDPLRRQATSHEPESLRRRGIEPLGVIDHAQEAALSCDT